MITHQDARSSMEAIESTMNRAARGLGYRQSAPHLLLWGAIWFVGYGLNGVLSGPQWHWLGLLAIGIPGSAWLGMRSARNLRQSEHRGLFKYALSSLVAMAFFASLLAILPPLDGRQVGAMLPLIVAAIYGITGIWGDRPRLALVGLAVALLVLTGYFLLPDHFNPIMAVAGGGALILGGLWMRKW